MAVSTAYSPLTFSGNGVTTAFAVTWPFLTGTLVVTLVGSTGVETVQTITTHYTVSGGTDVNGLPATGTVTMLTAPASGTQLRIERVTPRVQATTWTENDPFPQKTVEAMADRLMLIAQETGSGGSGPNDGITGDVMTLNSAGAVDFWDAEDQIIRNVADGVEDDDAVTKSQLDAAMMGETYFTQSGGGAATRTWQAKMRDVLSVKDFGAVGDGVTDDTTALNNAQVEAKARGAALYFPGGTYLTTTGVKLYSGCYYYGDGPAQSVIKQANGANVDVLWGELSPTKTGGTDSTGDDDWVLQNIGIDGNKTNNTSGSGIFVYGARYTIRDVFISNCPDDGLTTEFSDSGKLFGMEAYIGNLVVDTVGKHGVRFDGPHDSTIVGVIVIDASLDADDGYSGFYVSQNGRFVACHAWSRSTSANRMAYALDVDVGGGGSEFTLCHLEGANTNVRINDEQVTLMGCRIYSAWSGVNVLVKKPFTKIDAYLGEPGPGRPAAIGVKLGENAGDNASECYINVNGDDNQAGFIDFTYDDGNNIVICKGYNSAGTNVVGTPSASDTVMLHIDGGTTTDIVQFPGAVSIPGSIELGHASDTTVTRASAGNMAIEGNVVYRAGGTDVPVSDGGTGLSSGTSGGVPYFSSTSAMASSAELTVNRLVKGGGAGAAPAASGITCDGSNNLSGIGTIANTGNITITNGAVRLSDGFAGVAWDDNYLSGSNAINQLSMFAGGTEKQVWNSTQVLYPGLSTTASAANAFLDSGASNSLLRSTSSAAYKQDVENIEMTYAQQLLSMRPVWYRSTASADRSDWSWYGLIAEEVAAIEPRLVHWGYHDSDYHTVEVENPDGVIVKERRLNDGATKKPDGVQYERLAVLMLPMLKELWDHRADAERVEEAAEVLAGGADGLSDDDIKRQFPYVAAGLGITGDSLEAVARKILDDHNAWTAGQYELERARLKASAGDV